MKKLQVEPKPRTVKAFVDAMSAALLLITAFYGFFQVAQSKWDLTEKYALITLLSSIAFGMALTYRFVMLRWLLGPKAEVSARGAREEP